MRFPIVKLMIIGGLAGLLLLPTTGLRALGLGEARVNSYLGQPLDVSIRLLEADAAALSSLTVEQAGSADYQRLGVPTEALGLGLEVTLDRRVDPPVLRVTSRRVVNDPVVQVLMDARWASGRLLREYTLFLDPPLIEVAPPVRRAPSAAESPAPTAPPPPAAEAVPPPPPPRPASPPAAVTPPATVAAPEPTPTPPPAPVSAATASARTVGPIQAGQTLWSIAAAWRPDDSLAMNQIMLAILERNPEAFIDGNVNRLRRGAELSMPTTDEVRAINVTEAEQRMRAQMQAWRQQTERRDVPVISEAAVPVFDRPEEARPEPQPEPAHRLAVVPPEGEVFEDGPMVSEGELRSARSRLNALEADIYEEALASDDLLARIDNVRAALEERDLAGLAVANEGLADLEVRLRAAREERAEAERLAALASDDEADEIGAFFRELESELGLADGESALGADEAPPAEDMTPAVEEPVVQVEPAAPAAPVAVADAGRGLPIWLWLIGGFVILLAVLAAVLGLRRRGETGRTVVRASADPVVAARRKLAAAPASLAAHLGVLKALADREQPEAFADALDEMYRKVTDDSDPNWQAALALAARVTPNHPLLTPPETGLGIDDGSDSGLDDGLDDRTREMLGILDRGESRPQPRLELDDTLDAGLELADPEVVDDDFFSTDGDLADPPKPDSTRPVTKDGGLDPDLAALSNRVDQEDRLAANESEDSDDAPRFDFEFSPRSAEADDDGAALDALPVTEDDELSDFERDILAATGGRERGAEAAVAEEFAALADADEDDDAALRLDESMFGDEASASVAAEEAADAGLDSERAEPPIDEAEADEELLSFLAEPGSGSSEDGGAGDRAESALSDDDAEVKLDLARAYLSMDDADSARALLDEVIEGGSEAMRSQARALLDQL